MILFDLLADEAVQDCRLVDELAVDSLGKGEVCLYLYEFGQGKIHLQRGLDH